MKLLATACLIAMTSRAYAVDHLMRVDEVMISNQGTTASQFIEMQDPGESFPSTYSLRLFDAAGNNIGTIPLTVPPGTTRLTVATATAATQLGFTPNATLTVTLPTNGQACFGSGASANIHCLSWGTIASAIPGTSGQANGASPPDGMSLQLVGGVYTVGTPSPGAANTTAVPDAFVPPDASVPPDSSTPPDTAPGIDAPGGNPNPNNPSDDDGCNAGAGASWFALVGLVGLVALRRRRS